MYPTNRKTKSREVMSGWHFTLEAFFKHLDKEASYLDATTSFHRREQKGHRSFL